jgi:hypothetical protein
MQRLSHPLGERYDRSIEAATRTNHSRDTTSARTGLV